MRTNETRDDFPPHQTLLLDESPKQRFAVSTSKNSVSVVHVHAREIRGSWRIFAVCRKTRGNKFGGSPVVVDGREGEIVNRTRVKALLLGIAAEGPFSC